MGGQMVCVLNCVVLLGVVQTLPLVSTHRKVLVTKLWFGTVPREYHHNVTSLIDTQELRRVHGLSAWSLTDGHDIRIPDSERDTWDNKHNEQAREHPKRNRNHNNRDSNFPMKGRPVTFADGDGDKPAKDKVVDDADTHDNVNLYTGSINESKVALFPGSNSKIVGGSQTFPNGWPSEASIQYLGSDGYWYHFCGGSLVHEQWVVTVAHCLVELEDYIIRIVLGDYRLGSFDGREQIRLPSNIFVHTFFNKPLWAYDIGMIKLQSPAIPDSNVQAIGLATSLMEPFDQSHECYVAGWGSIVGQDDELVTPDYLQQTRMTIITKQECKHQLKIKDVLADSHICIESDLSSVCIGDSGSPLQCRVDGHWVLVGMASWIRDEQCEPSVPNVFTRISSFNSWCHDVIDQY